MLQFLKFSQQGAECRHEFGCNETIESRNDVIGHGTHVAGIAASLEYGVAKGAKIIPVKLIDIEEIPTAGRFTVRYLNIFKSNFVSLCAEYLNRSEVNM